MCTRVQTCVQKYVWDLKQGEEVLCIYMSIDMYIDVCIEVYIDMCKGMCIGMRVYMYMKFRDRSAGGSPAC